MTHKSTVKTEKPTGILAPIGILRLLALVVCVVGCQKSDAIIKFEARMVAEKAAEAAKVEQQARQVKEAEAMEEQAKADALKAIILADERRAKETAETAEAEARAIAAAKREERAKAAARSEDAALSQRTAERAATNRRKRAELAAKAAGISMARLNQLAKSIEPKFTIGRREENEAMALDVAIHAVERVTAIQDVGGFANLGFGEDNFDQTLDSEARKRARALTGR